MMLRFAVEGSLPLIFVRSDDLMHIEFTLSNMFSDYEVVPYGTALPDDDESDILYYWIDSKIEEKDAADMYEDAEEQGYSIIFVNGPMFKPMFDAGSLLPDKETIYSMIDGYVKSDIAEEVANYLYGINVQQIKQVLSLASVFYGRISVESIRKTKERLFLKQPGLEKVDRNTPYYFMNDDDVSSWVSTNHPYMYSEVDHRLVPKGMLLYGEPGTGKTELAKYIARSWDMSLFLLDINSMLSKWQGEAEHHLSSALEALDRESPCVVLFDEVEKLFQSGTENDTSQRLLSKLLWWLQYRTSRVFVVMTCNDLEALPPELYRAGRINEIYQSVGVKQGDAENFIKELLETFAAGSLFDECREHVLEKLNPYGDTERVPHASLSQMVVDYLQTQQFGLNGGLK